MILSTYHDGLVKKIKFLPFRRRVRSDLKKLIHEHASDVWNAKNPSPVQRKEWLEGDGDTTEKRKYLTFLIEQIENYLKEKY